MRLPWRYVNVMRPSGSAARDPDRPDLGCFTQDVDQIYTSLTSAETTALAKLARNGDVLEVGTAYGYSAIVMGLTAHSVITVDPHKGYGSMANSMGTVSDLIQKQGLSSKVMPIIGRSQHALPILFGLGLRFDLVFIDGDHRYDAVSADLLNGVRLLRSGGYLAVHDVGEETCPDVIRAVKAMFPDFMPGGHKPYGDDHWSAPNQVDTLWTIRRR